EDAAVAVIAFDFDIPTHQARQFAADGKPQSGSELLVGRRQLLKILKQQGNLVGPQPNSRVGNGDKTAMWADRVPEPANLDPATRRKLDGVGNQVDQDLFAALAVAAER